MSPLILALASHLLIDEVVLPSSVDVLLGRVVNGNISSLHFEDGNDFVVERFHEPGWLERLCAIRVRGFTTVQGAQSMQCRMRVRQVHGGVVELNISEHNYRTDQRTFLHLDLLSLQEQEILVTVPVASDYIRSDGQIQFTFEAWGRSPATVPYMSRRIAFELVNWLVR